MERGYLQISKKKKHKQKRKIQSDKQKDMLISYRQLKKKKTDNGHILLSRIIKKVGRKLNAYFDLIESSVVKCIE